MVFVPCAKPRLCLGDVVADQMHRLAFKMKLDELAVMPTCGCLLKVAAYSEDETSLIEGKCMAC